MPAMNLAGNTDYAPETPSFSNDYGLRKSSGGFAIFAAMRWCGPGPATGRTSNVLVRGHLTRPDVEVIAGPPIVKLEL